MRIVDGDGHVMEDSAKLAKFLPDPWRGNTDVARWFPPLDRFHAFTGTPPPGSFQQVGPEGWLDFLDDIGIETTVLYTTGGLAIGNVFHRDWAIALTKAYNDYVHEEYLVRSPRFQAMALIPMQEPEAAVDELARAVEELGFCGAMLPSTGLANNLGAKEFWPVYKEADRLGCALGVHGGAHGGLGFDNINVYTPVNAFGHPFGLAACFSALLFNGIFDRYPNARYGFMEGGVGWMVMALERLDRAHETHIQYNPRGELAPRGDESFAEYLRKHIRDGRIYVGCEGDEPSIAHAIQLLGPEPWVYSSDFPHEVNNDTCKEEIAEFIENPELTQADKEAVMHGNAERFYALKVPAAV
jgi:predicted TIM-barrel fold metal-dependent hydrolase